VTAKFIDTAEFRRLARRGDADDAAGVARLSPVAAAPDDGSRTVRFVLSDGSVDRMGDRIAVNGWELTQYKRNPTVLWAHDISKPPIGRMTQIFVSGNRLMGDVKFAPAATYEFADTVYRLVVDGFINAGSVGFTALEWKFASDPDRPHGINFIRQELLEFSIVPLPANAAALVDGRSLRSRRAADDPVRELGTLLGHMIRTERLRRALDPRTPAERVQRAQELKWQMWRDSPAGRRARTEELRAWMKTWR
jgi:HK97 family phage prohead protease